MRFCRPAPQTDPNRLRFFCPGCETVHDLASPPWVFNNNFEKPTLSPSILVTLNATDELAACTRCHSFITDGQIQFLNDCKHALAGKTVELPEIPEWARGG